jgi:rSAM/selenodomain-associated transferase 1
VITVCVFARPPVPGQTKTRLARTVGDERAAALAAAFLADTWALVTSLPWARPVIASTGAMPDGLVPGASVWPQGDGTLDQRIERILGRALAEVPGGAIALGADSPGLPRALLDEAHARLRAGDAVIGPADDGGFYLLGLRRCPPGLLAGVPWSCAETCAAVERRLAQHRLPVATLGRWFDVDHGDDLARLRVLLAADPARAPATAAVLEAA